MYVRAGTRFKPRRCFWINFQSLSVVLSYTLCLSISVSFSLSRSTCLYSTLILSWTSQTSSICGNLSVQNYINIKYFDINLKNRRWNSISNSEPYIITYHRPPYSNSVPVNSHFVKLFFNSLNMNLTFFIWCQS